MRTREGQIQINQRRTGENFPGIVWLLKNLLKNFPGIFWLLKFFPGIFWLLKNLLKNFPGIVWLLKNLLKNLLIRIY